MRNSSPRFHPFSLKTHDFAMASYLRTFKYPWASAAASGISK